MLLPLLAPARPAPARAPSTPVRRSPGAGSRLRPAIAGALEAAARSGVAFTADSLRADATVVAALAEAGDHAPTWGNVFATAHRHGMIQVLGVAASGRPARRGGVRRVWTAAPTWRPRPEAGAA